MESETAQASPLTLLSDMVTEEVKNNPKFQETAQKIIQNYGDRPTLMIIAKALNHIAEENGDVWTLGRALEEVGSHCNMGTAPESIAILLMQCVFGIFPRRDSATTNCCWHSRQFFREDKGIHYNALITNWILEGCFDSIDRVKNAYYEGYRVLMNLVECGLLKIEENQDNAVVVEKLVRRVPDNRYDGFIWKPTLGLNGVYDAVSCACLESVGPMDGMIKTCDEGWEKILVLLVDGDHLCREVIETYFQSLENLQVLAIFSPRIQSLPKSLTKLENLCFLVLRDCDLLEKIDGLQHLKALTVLEISDAKSLKDIPNGLFENLSKLRSLNLSGTGIQQLPSSLSNLRELQSINLQRCCYLKSLPMLRKLEKLELLDVTGATSLESFADKSIGAVKVLQLLDLSQTIVGHIPFLKDLTQLSRVSLRDCTKLIRLPSLRGLSGLQVLDLSGALMLNVIQDDIFPEVNDLKILDLSRTAVSCLPSSIRNLSNLELLNLSETLNLVELEDDTFKNMKCLRHLDLSKSLVGNLPSLSDLVNLRELKLQECKLQKLPSLIALGKLEVLDLSGCVSFVAFEDESFGSKTSLRLLNLSETMIEKLPALSDLDNLSQLLLLNCIKLTKLPRLSSPKLQELNVCDATELVEWEAKLPDHMDQLKILNLSGTRLMSPTLNNYTNLRELSLRGCKLQTTLQLDNLTKLEVLDLSKTRIKSLSSITRLCNLRQLLLTDCSELQEIPTLEPLANLEALSLQGTGIRKFPCLMAKLNRLMHLDLPDSADNLELDWTDIKSLPGELNWDQCGMPTKFQNVENRPFIIVRNVDSFRTMKEIPDLWNLCFKKFFISVCPSLKEGEEDGEIYVLQDRINFKDIYFHVISYQDKYAPFLEIRRFKSFPTGVEDALMQVEYVSLVENEFIKSLSELSNVNALKGCWIWSCTNLENLMRDEDNLKSLEFNLQILWISNLPVFRSVHSTGCQFESFKNLVQLYIDCCPLLETLFISSKLSKSLEILHVKFCDRLQSLYRCESKEECTLEKLHELTLVGLPELTDTGLKLPSLRTAYIGNCPKLGVRDKILEKFGLSSSGVEWVLD
ncbi:putative disease resistance protein At4g19050 [Momordica charantia]|uniref:Disease resistance protein At4g19050 n=1 Tax=Momordica charantia TaxID=3673 RepID=A0A6J1DHQ2_MOMCH|nr:putative disease resistance protein At4g19050 [Momordica charantia]XP_022153529.1 putative disease resistance protein At4g19050 [Momordica charantia]